MEVRLLVYYFVSRNLERGLSVSAMSHKLAGLAFLFKLQGGADFTKDFCIQQAMNGGTLGGRCPLTTCGHCLFSWVGCAHRHMKGICLERLFH